MRTFFLFFFTTLNCIAAGQILTIKSGDTKYMEPLPPSECGIDMAYGYTMKNYVIEGAFIVYEPKNKNTIYIEGVYKNGLKTGSWKYYYTTGVLCTITQYKDNIENGFCINFEQDGTISSCGPVKNGEREGIWQMLVNNTINYSGELHNGKREGLWTLYGENGNLKESHNCHESKFEGEFTAFYPSGKLQIKGYYRDHVETGSWIHYYESGQKQWEEDMATREKKFWDENGNLVKGPN